MQNGFENGVLGRVFGPKKEATTGGRTKLQDEQLHNLYYSPNTVRVMESRRMRWVGHTARMGRMRDENKVLVGHVRRRELVVHGRIILKSTLKQ
jgi:hypothetical protein